MSGCCCVSRVSLLAAVCGLAAPAGAQDPVPPHRVETLVRALSTEDARTWQGAMDDLVRAGEIAVPALLAELQRPDSDEGARTATVRVLGRIGRPAAPAVPHLVERFPHADPSLRVAIAIAVAEIGPYAPDHAETIRAEMMREVFRNRKELDARMVALFPSDVPPAVLRAHARTYVDPDSASDDLADALDDDNPFVREYALELLVERSDTSRTIVAALAQAVTQPHPKAVICTAEGEDREVEYRVDLDRRLRLLAARGLVARAPADILSVPAHVILLDRGDRDQRCNSAQRLGSMGAGAAAAVPALSTALEEGTPSVQRAAAAALGDIGPAAQEAVPALRRAKSGRNKRLAAVAARAIDKIEAK